MGDDPSFVAGVGMTVFRTKQCGTDAAVPMGPGGGAVAEKGPGRTAGSRWPDAVVSRRFFSKPPVAAWITGKQACIPGGARSGAALTAQTPPGLLGSPSECRGKKPRASGRLRLGGRSGSLAGRARHPGRRTTWWIVRGRPEKKDSPTPF